MKRRVGDSGENRSFRLDEPEDGSAEIVNLNGTGTKNRGNSVNRPGESEGGEPASRGGKAAQEKRGGKSDAYHAALRIVASGANSERMLREKLARKGFRGGEAAGAVVRLREAGLVNDRRLLFAHAEYLARRKLFGAYRIKTELYRKFDAAVVSEYFDEAVEEIDFQANAQKLAQTFASKGREAVVRKLRERGYTASEISKALLSADES